MFGFRFAKYEPGNYVFRFTKGKLTAEGNGISFYYYSPFTSILVVNTTSSDSGFMFSENTADFQEVTIQGQLTYRIVEPQKVIKLLNYTVNNSSGNYKTDDPGKLSERLCNLALVAAKDALKSRNLKEAIVSSDIISNIIFNSLANNAMVSSLGVEILDVSVIAVRPDKETAHALEASTRERILKESDDAVFMRRNSAVEQERTIRENEMNTEIAVGLKNREIQAIEIESNHIEQEKRQELEKSALNFRIEQEAKLNELIDLQTVNQRKEADNKAYGVAAILKAYQGAGKDVIELLANTHMDSSRMIALAFQELAGKAEKIGQLNITPDLLKSIINKKGK